MLEGIGEGIIIGRDYIVGREVGIDGVVGKIMLMIKRSEGSNMLLFEASVILMGVIPTSMDG